MIKLDGKYNLTVEAALDIIEREMKRLYWNKHQREIQSPFNNTGQEYINETFKVRAYYWGDDENMLSLPNFEYPGLEVFWYKHSGRGLVVYVNEDFTIDFLANMINNCIESLRRDFGEVD